MRRDPQDIKIGEFTLKEILERHLQYIQDFNKKDMRADLRNTNLRGADLCHVNLYGADLRSVNLSGADLYGANLYGVNLHGSDLHDADLRGTNLQNVDLCNAILYGANLENADLCNANLYGVDLHDAYLRGADLEGADLRYTNLHNVNLRNAILRCTNLYNANLYGADLHDADLYGADLREANLHHVSGNLIEFRKGKILTESIIGYKKCRDNIIVTLEIPRGAIVFSINGNKCRTNKAKVIGIEGEDRAYSKYNNMSYYIGDEITIYDFNCEYNAECVQGIHFYMTR